MTDDIFKKKSLPRTLKTVYEDINKAIEDSDGFVPADGSVTNAKLDSDVKVGSLAAFDTTDKTSVQDAVNEVVAAIGALETVIGDESTLDTTEKSEIVAAINEILAVIGDLDEEIKGEDGSLNDLTTTEKGSIIGAINELVTRLEVVEGET
jgi:hypothetical protein